MGYVTELFGAVSVVFAKSRAKARWVTIRAAREAGFDVPFTEKVIVRRAPKYDPLDTLYSHGRAWTPEFVDRNPYFKQGS